MKWGNGIYGYLQVTCWVLKCYLLCLSLCCYCSLCPCADDTTDICSYWSKGVIYCEVIRVTAVLYKQTTECITTFCWNNRPELLHHVISTDWQAIKYEVCDWNAVKYWCWPVCCRADLLLLSSSRNAGNDRLWTKGSFGWWNVTCKSLSNLMPYGKVRQPAGKTSVKQGFHISFASAKNNCTGNCTFSRFPTLWLM